MDIDFDLELRVAKAAVFIQAIINILINKGITTKEDVDNEYEKIRNSQEFKKWIDKIEYMSHVQKIAEKDIITEEDEKYIREKNDWDKKEDVEDFIQLIKWDSVFGSLLDSDVT